MVGATTSRGKSPSRELPPRRVAVFGAGRMGADIALAFALGGWTCDVVEQDGDVRARASAYWSAELRRMRARSQASNLRLHETVNDVQWQDVLLVVESIPEHLASKHELLRRIEQHARPSALITTNTSSLRIADVTGVLERPRRSAGLHFGLPAHVMPAVEVTPAGHTAPATVRKLVAWMEELGKVPVLLKKDVPGMLINRLQHAMYREIYHLMETGIADAIDIDRAVRFGFGLRYAIAGPVVSRDIHGVPVHLQVARQLYPTLHNGSTPSHLLEDMVRQGRHGVRTGRGFYKWDKKTVDVRLGHFNQLLEEAVRRITRRGEPTEF